VTGNPAASTYVMHVAKAALPAADIILNGGNVQRKLCQALTGAVTQRNTIYLSG
jgi:hypothetical protein